MHEHDVHRLLNELHERNGRVVDTDSGAFDSGQVVNAISQRAAALPGLPDVRPDVGRLLRLVRERTQALETPVRFYDVGTVQRIGNGVATLSGLPYARIDEVVTFPTGVRGLVLNLDHAQIDVILLGDDEGIQGGDLVTAGGDRLKVPVGPDMIGRVVNPLGEALDGAGAISASAHRYLENEAPGIIERAPVNEPLYTGVKIVDALFPVGRGQRILILGDRQTGKTSIAVDAILSQRDSDVRCIYVAIGQKKSSTLALIETLRRAGALQYTVVVMSSSDDPPALRYLAPYTGCTMAEYLLDDGDDVLVIYDDLTRHADAYRELSLLLRRPPGREAYPGDIFYLHSRLLERACKLNEDAGGGSITAVPIVETQRSNISAYIPTNLISITDGQIVLDPERFNRGVKPAVDVGLSVSRVGGAAQTSAMRAVAGNLRLNLAQFEEVARFTRFGTEVDDATQRQIQRGQRIEAVLTQSVHSPLDLAEQVIILWAATEGYLDDIALKRAPAFERALQAYFKSEHPDLMHVLNTTGELTDEIRTALEDTFTHRSDWFGVET